MKDKIISFVIWLILWGIIVYGYTYYTKPTMWNPGTWGTQPTMNVESMSDEQLEKMASRAWITVTELKSKISSWEDIRSLMWWNRGNKTSSWTTN